MALSNLPLFLAAIIHATSVYSHPLAEKRAGPSKLSGPSGSNALILDDYSAENEDVNEGILTRTNIIIISFVSGVSLILIVGSIFLFCWLRRSRKRKAARISFSEETQYAGTGEHHQELKVDENQPLYPQINLPPQHTHHAHHASHASHSSYISHGSHPSHDSTHDQHLSLLSAYDHPPPAYGNSPPNQYSPLHAASFEPSFPAPTAAPAGLPHLSPPSGGEAAAYYGR